jgi:TPR repeat protein
MLLRGFGLKEDEPKTIKFLTSAANKGVPGAQNRLAHVYLEGVGVEKSMAEAAKWRILASAGGIEDGKLDLLLESLSENERQAAQKAAQEWQDKRFSIR